MKGQLTILTPQNVVAECLEMAFGLKAYTGIINEVAKTGFKATPEFRKVYNAYFRVRQRAPEWYDEFYAQMEAQKITRRSFGELLRIMQPVNGKLELCQPPHCELAHDYALLPNGNRHSFQSSVLLFV